ncbi:hypothetical protein ABID65_009089 [Bradyrhizobium sp. S3.9.2]|uniref:hypothetical protein n=1 Tax=Bradyrhizobium sp. S3.9.2 TaxID=3156432 RepID=UPI00339193E3
MNEGHRAFTAASSAAGYYYQARLALFESLRIAYGDSSIDVAIERFDDVSFETAGTPLELLQTKHHINKVGDLTDSSPDLWKTLRVWAEAAKENPSLPSRTRFVLLTTGHAPDASAASYLRADGNRDVEKVELLLSAAAAASTNHTLKAAFLSFQSLTPEMRTSLLGAIEILDQAPEVDLPLPISSS